MTNIVQQNIYSNYLEDFKKPGNLPPPSPRFVETDQEVNNLDYRFESARLKSFRKWPVSFVNPTTLAAAGFYYVGESDRVQCFECQVELYNWEQGDIPMVDHERSSPNCRFVRNIPCGNVPIGTDPALVILPNPRSQDVCGIYNLTSQSKFDKETNKLRSLGFERPKSPAYLKYASIESRIRSFDTWPKPLPPDKNQLAEAGFFYTGKEDQTVCFHCGGGLKDWKPEDDPWEQHAKWFSKCYYLLMAKGKEYVNAVTGQCVTSSSSSSFNEVTLNIKLIPFIEKLEEQSLKEVSESKELENNPKSENNDIKSSSSNSPNSMRKKKYEEDGRLCKICYSAEMSIVFLPCKHMVSCLNCASTLSQCPICRKPIDLVISAILS
ncbi:putative inhibitor of apoptosis [Vespa velutina]|uniref:putative inhibitor of apoptosis n=1 Tax=Vespa velutina TaxID=202808 RepID=UPI001FB43B53|nr:putative inhibitor of apoptosis [Vespa velutina]XP_047350467.1 putative inhibitor of apoptosis [Vespa velutina]